MSSDVVVGIYLEREGGALMQADVSDENGQKRITPTNFIEYEWDSLNAPQATESIRQMADRTAETGSSLKSVAIASYGPFLSHQRAGRSNKYVELSPGAHMPLRVIETHKIFIEKISDIFGNKTIPVSFHVDSVACAIGESISRSIDDDHILAYLIVTEGIGLGVVRGRRPLSSAMHSEAGLLHVRYLQNDPLRPPKEYNMYYKSLSDLSDNNSLRKRYALHYNKGHIEDIDIMNSTDNDIWDIRSYYLAQACFACAVTMFPHKIIIGADIDENTYNIDRNIARMTSYHFKNLLNSRYIDGHKPFHISGIYDESGNYDEGYISLPESIPIERQNPKSPFRVTGSLGMCYAAAMHIPGI